jgi:hypothetical protein
VAWFQAVRGRRHQHSARELKPAVGSSNEKEANHGNEEEKEEDGEAGSRKVTTQARASYWGGTAAFRDSGRT